MLKELIDQFYLQPSIYFLYEGCEQFAIINLK
jgi:hypothetical protein